MDEKTHIVLDIRQVPAVLFAMRRELVRMLRAEAGSETNPDIAVKLRAVAAAYEMGMKRVPKS